MYTTYRQYHALFKNKINFTHSAVKLTPLV